MASAIISEIHVHPSSRRIITKRTIARRVVSRMSDPITVTTYSQVPTCGAGLRRSTKLLVDSNSWKMAYWHQWCATRRPMPWLHGCLRNAKKAIHLCLVLAPDGQSHARKPLFLLLSSIRRGFRAWLWPSGARTRNNKLPYPRTGSPTRWILHELEGIKQRWPTELDMQAGGFASLRNVFRSTCKFLAELCFKLRSEKFSVFCVVIQVLSGTMSTRQVTLNHKSVIRIPIPVR